MSNLQPYELAEMYDAFIRNEKSTGRHLLVIYLLVIGINAKVILDLGLGSTTRALRAAALKTEGTVLSCDADVARFSDLLGFQDESWRITLSPSELFLQAIQPPIDFVMHDAAHDYYQVKLDLGLILPKMRQFGLICVHDTQQPDLGRDILTAIRDATNGYSVSMTHLPFSAGLTIIRVEESCHPPITPATCFLPDGRPATELIPFGFTRPSTRKMQANPSVTLKWIRWKLRKLIKGY